jgi:hypothetical protein
MDDRWFGLGDHCRYAAQEMRELTIHPVRTNEWKNHWLRWPRRKQVLASMLLWASRAGATTITFDPKLQPPLVYSNEKSDSITTELGPPPEHVSARLLQYFYDIANDKRLFGVLPPIVNLTNQNETILNIKIPDIETSEVQQWIMTLAEQSAVFVSISGASRKASNPDAA